MKIHPQASVWLCGAAAAAAYVILDLVFLLGHQPLMNSTALFDFSSFWYSSLEVAAGRPLLPRDQTFYGLPTYLYHSFFLRLGDGSAASLRLGIAVASAAWAALVYLLTWRALRSPWRALAITIALWPSLSGFAFGFGYGYGAYFVFLMLFAGLLVVDGQKLGAWPAALTGVLGGTAYATKHELGLLTICVLWQAWLWRSAGTGKPSAKASFAIALLLTAAGGFAWAFGLPGWSVLPLLLFWLIHARTKLDWRGWLRRSPFFWLGALGALAPWVIALAAEAGWRFALRQYFPYLDIGEQLHAMSAHHAYAQGPLASFAALFTTPFYSPLSTGLWFFGSMLALVWLGRAGRVPPWWLASACAIFLIYLRDSFVSVYHSWGTLPLVLASLLFYRPGTLLAARARVALFTLVFGVYGGLAAWRFVDQRFLAWPETLRYSQALGIAVTTPIAEAADELKAFFTERLPKDKTIYVLGGQRLPYVLAGRPAAPEGVRASYYLTYNAATEEALIAGLAAQKSSLAFIVRPLDAGARFTGPDLAADYSRLAAWVEKSSKPVARFGIFEVREVLP